MASVEGVGGGGGVGGGDGFRHPLTVWSTWCDFV